MATIEKSCSIAAAPELVWETLVTPRLIEQWGAGPDAQFDAREGGSYSLWGDSIKGAVLDADEDQRLVIEWRQDGYDYVSEVTFTFVATEEGTDLTVLHTGVKEADVEEFDRGWDEYVLAPVKELCEGQGVA